MKQIHLLICAVFLFGQGCAIILDGSTQDVTVDSSPAGARIMLNGQFVGMTPSVVKVPRKKGVSLSIQKDGYRPAPVPITSRISSSFWMGFLVGGCCTTDYLMGSYLEYTPNSYYIRLDSLDRAMFSPLETTRQANIKKTVFYVLTNYSELLVDSARAKGEYISGLASLTGESDLAQLAKLIHNLHKKHAGAPQFAEAVAATYFGKRVLASK